MKGTLKSEDGRRTAHVYVVGCERCGRLYTRDAHDDWMDCPHCGEALLEFQPDPATWSWSVDATGSVVGRAELPRGTSFEASAKPVPRFDVNAEVGRLRVDLARETSKRLEAERELELERAEKQRLMVAVIAETMKDIVRKRDGGES